MGGVGRGGNRGDWLCVGGVGCPVHTRPGFVDALVCGVGLSVGLSVVVWTAFSASASPPPSSPRSSPQPPRQTWKINEWLANRLCEILNGLMKGDYTFLSPQSVVYYVIDAIQSLGITPGIIEQLVSLPWVASNRLVRMQVASVVSQHEQ